MYKSPIEIIQHRANYDCSKQLDEAVFTAVVRADIHVERDELIKALQYDRDQYQKGFEDGKSFASQWISVKDDLPKEHDSIFSNHTHLSKHMWAKESDNVIVYVRFPDGTGRSTEGRLQDGKWWTRVSPMLEPVVTHWMQMPEPPEEVKQDET